jgi:hypothetical protein
VNGFLIKYPAVNCLLPAIVVAILRLSCLSYLPIPEPGVHDEFSYLLGAETFVSGRLANPPHPMWVHFETFHVNLQPTYASKYPPGQSLFLALGQKLFGHPWYGVVISVSLMCACICWMLQGWLPLRDAMWGSLLAVIQFGLSNYWINSYWGGALAAAGGALVLGALPRLARKERTGTALLAACGMALLANTRPYEGLITTLAAAIALLWWRKKVRRPWHSLFKAQVIVPATVLLGVIAIAMGYYNYRVTGKPWLLPYVVNQEMYAASPHLWLLPDGPPPKYRHELLRTFWTGWDRDLYLKTRANPLRMIPQVIAILLRGYMLPLLVLPLTVMLVPTRKVRLALGICGALAVGLILEKGLAAHYYAPVTGLIIFLASMGTRGALRTFPPRSIARPVIGTAFVVLFLYVFAFETLKSATEETEFTQFVLNRRLTIQSLMRQGPRHLVIVRYAHGRNPNAEWVYNSADIDASSIVWARDMGDAQNSELIDYYRDRQIWLLEPDAMPLRLHLLSPIHDTAQTASW